MAARSTTFKCSSFTWMEYCCIYDKVIFFRQLLALLHLIRRSYAKQARKNALYLSWHMNQKRSTSAQHFHISAVLLMNRYKSRVNKLVRVKEEEMNRKRNKVPGTPGVAMQDGKALIAMGDVMVTWYVAVPA